MKTNLFDVKAIINSYAEQSNTSETEVIEQLKVYYFNKEVNKNLKLYKKGKKKVRDITKDLKISHRKFYAILEQKNIAHKKYNKANSSITLDR
ncbi:hypothetical protein [Psychroserpens damuponensis]|uniref:hypothetical protein n=1 Tax=Psychroserpens damuponensis TaxID=943936 RepID=UPI00058DCD92|nr:hypothetical protein [Psychroserpens damuponensis]